MNPESKITWRIDNSLQVQLYDSQNQDSLMSSRNADRKRLWRKSQQASETLHSY